MKLPDLCFDLPEWQERDFRQIHAAREKLVDLSGKAGQGSGAFKNACTRLIQVSEEEPLEIGKMLVKPMDVRACTFLMATDKTFSTAIQVNDELLTGLLRPKSTMSRLTLVQLIRAYFTYFDELAGEAGLGALSRLIKLQLSSLALPRGPSDLALYAENAELLFCSDGPANLVGYARQHDSDLDGVIDRLALKSFSGGRFLTLCRYQYYIETLRDIPVGGDHYVLSEVVKPMVANSPLSHGRHLGHQVLSILIDRSEGQGLSQAWQNVILTIAGDPRVPKSSEKYQRWWTLLGEKRISLMRGWLSRFDLKLFLDVLAESTKDTQNSEMARMFPPRKRFLEGLLEEGVIQESRLFLTSSAERTLRRNVEGEELPSFANVKGGHASVIYLKVKGGAHLVEGTHSFSIRVMNQLPEKSGIGNYSMRSFHSRSLGPGLGQQYLAEYGDYKSLLEQRHHPDLAWQNAVIRHLAKLGVSVNAHALILPEQYRDYKASYGS